MSVLNIWFRPGVLLLAVSTVFRRCRRLPPGCVPAASEKISKISASRPRVFISRARFAFTRMRPRAVARRSAAAKTFTSIFLGVACAAESPQTARADDRGGAEMIKIRVQGLPDEVAEFADALEATGCVLERSEPYANRGGSRYVRVYIEAEKRAADGGAREIEEG